jgi:hypothetical protein
MSQGDTWGLDIPLKLATGLFDSCQQESPCFGADRLHLNASIYTCLQILSVSVFEKTEISCALQVDNSAFDLPASANQLNLLNI